jgi:RNA polymerase sigma factor (sigma-70 family)
MISRTRLTLLDKLKSNHDQHAWYEFYNNYQGYIGAVIKNLNVRPSDIDDLIQKVMLISWEKLPGFEYDSEKGLFRSWLIRIAKNVVMSYFRSTFRNSNKLQKFADDPLSDYDANMDQSAEKEWRVHVSMLAWQSIRGNYDVNAQNTFDLVSKGLKNKEIATKIELKVNTVAVYKKRIMAAMKDEIRRLDQFLS